MDTLKTVGQPKKCPRFKKSKNRAHARNNAVLMIIRKNIGVEQSASLIMVLLDVESTSYVRLSYVYKPYFTVVINR